MSTEIRDECYSELYFTHLLHLTKDHHLSFYLNKHKTEVYYNVLFDFCEHELPFGQL